MLIPKKNRVAIYEYLFKEGTLVAKKDFHAARHPDIDVPNLQVIKTLTSLQSRGYVKEQFCWRHYYWVLTNEGISYIRDFLHLPAEIVPATLRRRTQPDRSGPQPRQRGPTDERARGPVPDRREYRRPDGFRDWRDSGNDKKADVGAGANESFQFRGGFGRGQPRYTAPRHQRDKPE